MLRETITLLCRYPLFIKDDAGVLHQTIKIHISFRFLQMPFFVSHAINGNVLSRVCLLTVAVRVQQIHCLLQKIQIELDCFPTWPSLSHVRHREADLLTSTGAIIIS